MSYGRQSVHVRIVLDVICAHSYLGYTRHFTDGLHIGDAATLARLAAEVGVAMDDFPPGELRARLHRVRALGITAVPVFLIGSLPPLTGTQTEDTLYAALKEAAQTNGEDRDR
ncbi:hypothetical protein GCM10023196_043450 [Actinoallomurus vinaceus]|uniref:DSBA-like thioredoxin domain-containing protein n=1 Tax=Actinoallomurus vinaceus TaxID=1080074 RepID=A0ABP8UBN7_9ACTN